jgi:hypothetical protein
VNSQNRVGISFGVLLSGGYFLIVSGVENQKLKALQNPLFIPLYESPKSGAELKRALLSSAGESWGKRFYHASLVDSAIRSILLFNTLTYLLSLRLDTYSSAS